MRRLAHLSDIHFGALDAPVAEALVPYLLEIAPDVLVVSGDLSMRARPWQFRQAMEWLGRFQCPRVVVPGNHDVPLLAIHERATNPLGRYKRNVTSELSPIYEDDELAIFGITTARAFVPLWSGFWKDGSIAAKDLAHIAAHLEKYASDRKRKVLATHHPFTQPPGKSANGVILGGKKALPTLAQLGVDVLLAGHLHACYHKILEVESDGAPYGLLSVQASTATSHRRRHAPDGTEYPNGFNLLAFDGEALSLEEHLHLGGNWRPGRRTKFRHSGAGWQISP